MSDDDEEKTHKYELGSVVVADIEMWHPGNDGIEVSLQGTCRLIVVGHALSGDRTPLYVLSDLPVKYPIEEEHYTHDKLMYRYLATLVEFGYEEDSLRPTGDVLPLKDTIAQWLQVEAAPVADLVDREAILRTIREKHCTPDSLAADPPRSMDPEILRILLADLMDAGIIYLDDHLKCAGDN